MSAPDRGTGQPIADRYEVLSVAGTGGMGIVYRARDRVTGKDVAVKTIRDTAPNAVARFQREGALLRELVDPGIVRFHDHGASESGELFLAMEWLDGFDLETRLREGPLSVPDSLTIGIAVARALATAHARGVLHRDIKPSNLFLVNGEPSAVKILDFGLAWIGDSASRQTKTGTIVGTPGYMAPEQAISNRELDARADVFSLGAVLYECLAGSPPFVADHLLALLAKIALEDPPPLAVVRRAVPRPLDDLVMRCLAKDRARRPASALAVESELSAIAESLAKGSGPLAPTVADVRVPSGERQLVCVALAAPTGATESGEDLSLLDQDISAHGASMEKLADGTLIAVLRGRGVATDRATAAARCALMLRDRLPNHTVVLTTGLAVVDGRIPTGDAIDRAVALLRARSAAGTPANAGVFVDDVTLGLVRARFNVDESGPSPMVVAFRPDLDDTRTLLGKPTPFVGRDRELVYLLGLFEESSSEPAAHAVIVTAPAGTGKSRLRSELLAEIAKRAPEAEVWFGRGDPISAGSPFALLAPAIRRAAGIIDGEPIAVRRTKLAERIARVMPKERAAAITELVAEMIGAPFTDEEASVQLRAARQNPLQMADRMRSAWEELVGAECAAHPLVLVLEDVHWGDLPSVTYVDAALRAHHGAPLFVLALARPEVSETFPRLWADRGVQELRLPELTKRAATALVRHALPSSSDEVVARILERAEGNAFYLEELVRAQAEGTGAATATLLAMAQSRAEGLPADERRLLRAASVFGEVFWRGAVAEVAGTPIDETESGLRRLTGRELIVKRPAATFPDEIEYGFRHGLLRDGAYATLADDERRAAHLAAGAWLERAGEANALVVAEHLERGGAGPRAAEHYARAAQQAFDGSDFARSAECAVRGLDAGAEGLVRGDLAGIGSFAQAWRSQWADAVRLGEIAMRDSRPGSRAWSLAASAVPFGQLTLGHPENVIPVLQALCVVEPAAGARSALAWAISSVTTIIYFGGGPRAVVDLLIDRLTTITEPVLATEPAARANYERAMAYADRYLRADLEGALSWTTRALASFDEAGDRPTQSLVALDRFTMLAQSGAFASSLDELRGFIAMTDAFGLETPGSYARVMAARAGCELGDEALLRSCADWVLARADRAGYPAAMIHQTLGEDALRRGDLAAAERESKLALASLSPTSSDALAARATLTRTLIAAKRPQEALAVAEENVRQLDDTTTVKVDECCVVTTLAEAQLANGLDAKPALARARDMLLMRANKFSDATKRAVFLDSLEANRRTRALVEEHLGEVIDQGSRQTP